MRKTSRERFGPTASGTCPTCEKHIQVNLGKHVALYHLYLAQLWRCPVPWCTVWKGTSQDCVDHMRKAHDTPVFVKAGNLAQWFRPWTVTREQWHSMSRPSVSGIAIDTFLFSRIGVPLFHRYRVFDQQGSHPAFRGMYMPKVFDFLRRMSNRYVAVTDVVQKNSPQVCHKGSLRARKSRPLLLRHNEKFSVPRLRY